MWNCEESLARCSPTKLCYLLRITNCTMLGFVDLFLYFSKVTCHCCQLKLRGRSPLSLPSCCVTCSTDVLGTARKIAGIQCSHSSRPVYRAAPWMLGRVAKGSCGHREEYQGVGLIWAALGAWSDCATILSLWTGPLWLLVPPLPSPLSQHCLPASSPFFEEGLI